MNLLGCICLALFFGIFPLAACLLVDKNKRRLHSFGVLIAILSYSLVSWVVTNGFVALKYLLDPVSFRGPEGAFALFFGWLYLWITSIPVFLLYIAVRIIFRGAAKGNCSPAD